MCALRGWTRARMSRGIRIDRYGTRFIAVPPTAVLRGAVRRSCLEASADMTTFFLRASAFHSEITSDLRSTAVELLTLCGVKEKTISLRDRSGTLAADNSIPFTKY